MKSLKQKKKNSLKIMRYKGDIKTEIFLICSTRKDFLTYVNT